MKKQELDMKHQESPEELDLRAGIIKNNKALNLHKVVIINIVAMAVFFFYFIGNYFTERDWRN